MSRFDAQRMDALAFLAGGISHDLANPLGAMLAFASYLATDPRLPPDLRDDARLLRAEADRTHRMVRTLLEFARNRPPTITAVDLPIVISEVLELEAYMLAGIEVDRAVPDNLPPVETDPSRLRHLVLVLSVEALRRLRDPGASGRLRVTAEPAPGVVRMLVEYAPGTGSAGGDSPDGDSPDAPGSALEAARAIADDIGIRLAFRTTGTGGCFELEIPAPGSMDGRRDRLAAGLPGIEDGPLVATPLVLVCDDEDSIRLLLARILDKGGFRCLQASTPLEALRLIETEPVDVVLSDQHMRGMTGIELYRRATELRPELASRFVLMSGDSGTDEVLAFAEGTGVRVLGKPFDLAAIAGLIRELSAG